MKICVGSVLGHTIGSLRPVGEGKDQDWAHLEGELQCHHNNRSQSILGELYSLDGPLKLHIMNSRIGTRSWVFILPFTPTSTGHWISGITLVIFPSAGEMSVSVLGIAGSGGTASPAKRNTSPSKALTSGTHTP